MAVRGSSREPGGPPTLRPRLTVPSVWPTPGEGGMACIPPAWRPAPSTGTERPQFSAELEWRWSWGGCCFGPEGMAFLGRTVCSGALTPYCLGQDTNSLGEGGLCQLLCPSWNWLSVTKPSGSRPPGKPLGGPFFKSRLELCLEMGRGTGAATLSQSGLHFAACTVN